MSKNGSAKFFSLVRAVAHTEGDRICRWCVFEARDQRGLRCCCRSSGCDGCSGCNAYSRRSLRGQSGCHECFRHRSGSLFCHYCLVQLIIIVASSLGGSGLGGLAGFPIRGHPKQRYGPRNLHSSIRRTAPAFVSFPPVRTPISPCEQPISGLSVVSLDIDGPGAVLMSPS